MGVVFLEGLVVGIVLPGGRGKEGAEEVGFWVVTYGGLGGSAVFIARGECGASDYGERAHVH